MTSLQSYSPPPAVVNNQSSMIPYSKDKKVDPIQNEMVNPEDPAKAYDQVSNTDLKRWNQYQKTEVSVTYLGKVFDYFNRSGEYHPLAEKIKSIRDEKSQIDPCCHRETMEIIEGLIRTSSAGVLQPDGNCDYTDPIDYNFAILGKQEGPENNPNRLQRLHQCIKDFYARCAPNCFPCRNATEAEKVDGGRFRQNIFWFKSHYLSNYQWTVWMKNFTTDSLYFWKGEQIYNLFAEGIEECENLDRLRRLMETISIVTGLGFIFRYSQKRYQDYKQQAQKDKTI